MASKLRCSICLNNFTKPKLLPCHHTFCEHCIADYVNAQAHCNKFNCPICRQEVTVPKGGVHGFVTNFYLEVSDDDKQYCTKHNKKQTGFYCRDCSESCCFTCVTVDHKDHTLADLDEVDKEMRQIVTKLKTESEKKLKQLQEHSIFLKTNIADMDNSCKAACIRVDKQIDNICKNARTIGGTIKHNINEIGAKENSKLTKILDDVERMVSKMKESCEYADRILLHRCIITTVDTQELEDAQIRTDYNISTCLHTPIVRHPCYSMEKVDVECLKQLLGEVQTMDDSTFTSSFSLKQLKPDEMQDGNYVIIHGLPWCVGIRYNAPLLCIYLALKEVEDKTIKTVTFTYTLKLLNINDDSKSVFKQDTYTCTPGDNINSVLISMDRLQNKMNGFLDEKMTFVVQTNVNIDKIQRQ